jgi:hypothetical protein
MYNLLPGICCFLLLLHHCMASKRLHVSVNGAVLCHGKPLADAKVELFERDSNFDIFGNSPIDFCYIIKISPPSIPCLFTVDEDDSMGPSATTSADGIFLLNGERQEFLGDIKPYLVIEHSCPVLNVIMILL